MLSTTAAGRVQSRQQNLQWAHTSNASLFFTLVSTALLPLPHCAYAASVELKGVEVTSQGTVRVVESESLRVLLLDSTVLGAEHTAAWARPQPAFAGMALMQTLRFVNPTPATALCLGMGAGTVPHHFREHAIATDVVEFNAAVMRLAQSHFAFGEQHGPGRDILADAFAFVSEAEERRLLDRDGPRYDVVLSDLYNGENPLAGLNAEFFSQIRSALLNANGVLAVNIVAHREEPHAQLGCSVYRTLAKAFQYTRAFSDSDDSEEGRLPSNLLFFASDVPIDLRPPQYPDAAEDSVEYLHAHFMESEWTPREGCGLFLASSQNVPSWLSTERAAVASGMKEVQRPALPDEGWQLVEGLASARDGIAEQDCVAP